MTAEIGHFALVLALLIAAVQATLPMIGAHRGNPEWMAVAKPAALVQFGLVALSFGSLMQLYLTSDFSVHGRTQRAQAGSTRPSISAAMANEKAMEKPT